MLRTAGVDATEAPVPNRRRVTASTTAPVRLSVVVPAFQEEGRLGATVRDLCSVLSASLGASYEIVVVDDGSTDGTFEEAAAAADGCARCRVISYPRNAGKGYALRRGFASARGDLVAFCDADGEISGRTLLSLVRSVHGDVGAVVGRRRWEVARPWHRRLASATLSRFAQIAFDLPVPETQSGVKVFVRADVAWTVAGCREDGYLFDLELLVRLRQRGVRMASVDIVQTRTRSWRIGLVEGLREVGPALRIWGELRARPAPPVPARARLRPVAARSAGEDRGP